MNSRQRILAAIQHVEPDGLPLDIGATPSSGVSAIAYGRLVRHLQLNDQRNRVYDVVQQVSQPSDEFLDHFRVDVVDIGRAFNTQDSDWVDVHLPDGSPAQQPSWFQPQQQTDGSWLAFVRGEAVARMPAGFASYDQTIFPFLDGYPDDLDQALDAAMGRVHWAALAHSPWDHAADQTFWDDLRSRAIQLRASTERALMVVAGCNLFEWGTFLRRLDNFLMDLVSSPAQVERLLDALLERHLATLEKVCRAVGDVVDVIRLGDDLGMNSGPLMSPQTYRRLFKPRHQALCDYIHRHSRMHILLHSCGSLYRLLPDLIEAGFEIFNPVQTNTQDMQAEKLKREFGAQVTFWGAGADTRSILNAASPSEVRDHVRRNIEILAPGGGFVFNAIHNILPDVPPENIVAMLEAVDEYR